MPFLLQNERACMMRKSVWVSICIACAVALCAACAPAGDKTLDIGAFCQDVLETVVYDDELIPLSDRLAGEYYDLDFDGLEEYVIYVSATSATANELAVMRLSDQKAVEAARKAVEKRIAAQTAVYKNYRPDELFRLENAVVTVRDNHLLFSASPDNSAVQKLFEQSFQ
jgi:hypothetical protein